MNGRSFAFLILSLTLNCVAGHVQDRQPNTQFVLTDDQRSVGAHYSDQKPVDEFLTFDRATAA